MEFITEQELENLLEKNGLEDFYYCDHSWDARTLEVEINGKDYAVEYFMELDEYLDFMGNVFYENDLDEDYETFEDWIEENKDEFMTKEELENWNKAIKIKEAS